MSNDSIEQDVRDAPKPTYEELKQKFREKAKRGSLQSQEWVEYRAEQERVEKAEQTAAALRAQAEADAKAKASERGFFEDPTNEDTGVIGFLDNTVEILGTAISNAETQIVNTLGDLGQGLGGLAESAGTTNSHFVWGDSQYVGEANSLPIPFTNKRVGYISGADFRARKALYELETGQRAATLSDFQATQVDAPDSDAGQMVEAMTRWAIVFAATRKAVGLKGGGLAAEASAGAVADFTAFDPHEERLSNMVQDLGKGNPVFDNVVTEWLAAKETDSELEGRLNSAIEGLFLGAAVDVAMKSRQLLKNGLKWMRERRAHQRNVKIARAHEKAGTGKIDLSDAKPDEVADEVVEQIDTTGEAAVPRRRKADAPEAEQKFDINNTIERIRNHGTKKMSAEAINDLGDAFARGDFGKIDELTQFNELKIELDDIEETEDLIAMMGAYEDAAREIFDKASPKTTFETIEGHARALGYRPQVVKELYTDVAADGGIAARMYAAHQTMVASGRHLVALAKKAQATGSNEDKLKLFMHVERHGAIMARTKGAQRGIAQAMSGMRMMRNAAAESFDMLEEVRQISGDSETQHLIKSILASQSDLGSLNGAVEKLKMSRWRRSFYEMAINGMLSSPATHVINLASNFTNLIIGPVDRYVAAMLRPIAGGAEQVTFREANAHLAATVRSLGLAFRMAGRAFADGKPVSDLRQRVEYDTHRAIRGEVWLSNTKIDPNGYLGTTIDLLGDIIRLPGRALLTGDEFFKTINKQGEMMGVATRRAQALADKMELKGKARTKFIKDEAEKIVKTINQKDSIHIEAQKRYELGGFETEFDQREWVEEQLNKLEHKVDHGVEAMGVQHARYATFQEDATTEMGRGVGNLLAKHPMVKLVIAPFYRTPMNLLRQAFADRNPLFIPLTKHLREQIKNGGVDRQMAIARMTVGAAAAVSTIAFMRDENGEPRLIGKRGSWGNTERLDGVKDYSVKFGNRWYTFNRLDPMGSILGLTADFVTAMEHVDPLDPDQVKGLEDYSKAVGLAYMQNALNKTWMASLSDLLETAATATDPGTSEAYSDRMWAQFLGDQLGKGIPYSSAMRALATAQDPIVRQAWTIRDRLYKMIPGLSDDLPPTRDVLGREVTRERAPLYWMNPFGANPESDDPLDQELARLAFDTPVIQKTIKEVPLDNQQFAKYKELMGNPGINGIPPLEDTLRKEIAKDYWKDPETTDGVRVDVVRRIMGRYRQAASKLMMLEYPDLQEKITGRRVAKKQLLTNRPLLEDGIKRDFDNESGTKGQRQLMLQGQELLNFLQ